MRYLLIALLLTVLTVSPVAAHFKSSVSSPGSDLTFVAANPPTPSTLLDGIDWDDWLMLDGIDWDDWLLGLFRPLTPNILIT